MFPAELWGVLLREKAQLSKDDLIIELYQGWKSYWKNQFPDQARQADSLVDFNRMIDRVQMDDDLLEAAHEINGPVMLPVIALSIKRQYPRKKEFLADCVLQMTQHYEDQIGNGQLFVRVGPEGYPEEHTYFIYTVDQEF